MTLDPVIRETIRATVQEGIRKAPRTVFRPAVVIAVDPVSALPIVQCDGPDEPPFGAQLVSGAVFPGDRVEVMFIDPHGAFVLGRRGGDYDDWHVVGNEEEPAFNTGWQHLAGTSYLNTNAQAFVSFRRLYRLVELRGAADRTSGTAARIFTLPPDYRPENDLSFVVPNNIGTAFVIVRHAGGVEMIGGDPTQGVALDSVKFTVNPPISTGDA